MVGGEQLGGWEGGETISGSEKPLITVVEGQSVLMCFFLWTGVQHRVRHMSSIHRLIACYFE